MRTFLIVLIVKSFNVFNHCIMYLALMLCDKRLCNMSTESRQVSLKQTWDVIF